jgi:hypothetical protein
MPPPPHIVNAAKLSDPSSVRRLMRTHLQRYTRFLGARVRVERQAGGLGSCGGAAWSVERTSALVAF